jgi:hypothetical protein
VHPGWAGAASSGPGWPRAERDAGAVDAIVVSAGGKSAPGTSASLGFGPESLFWRCVPRKRNLRVLLRGGGISDKGVNVRVRPGGDDEEQVGLRMMLPARDS